MYAVFYHLIIYEISKKSQHFPFWHPYITSEFLDLLKTWPGYSQEVKKEIEGGGRYPL